MCDDLVYWQWQGCTLTFSTGGKLTFSVTGAKHDLVAQIIFSKPLWIIMNKKEPVLGTLKGPMACKCHFMRLFNVNMSSPSLPLVPQWLGKFSPPLIKLKLKCSDLKIFPFCRNKGKGYLPFLCFARSENLAHQWENELRPCKRKIVFSLRDVMSCNSLLLSGPSMVESTPYLHQTHWLFPGVLRNDWLDLGLVMNNRWSINCH